MDVEKIGGPGGSKSEKKERKSSPDSDEFREMMKTEKVREIELEGKRKRQYKKEEEKAAQKSSISGPTSEKEKLPSPYESYQHNKTPRAKGKAPTTQGKTKAPLPKEKQGIDKDSQAKQKEKKQKEEDKKVKERLKEKEITTPLVKKELQKAKLLEEKEKEDKIRKAKEEKKFIETATISKKEDKKKEDKKEKFIEKKHELSQVIQEMPSAIATQTEQLTATLAPYLHSDITPLFEKMVGTILQIQKEGITKTEIILNSKAFESSIFYGTRIVLEKYTTAPDSFNIILKGPNQAVALFGDNIQGLYDAFRRGNFNFRIGRLSAEYERPLFKRKEKTSDKDSEAGGN